jgi:hypothetical protein
MRRASAAAEAQAVGARPIYIASIVEDIAYNVKLLVQLLEVVI